VGLSRGGGRCFDNLGGRCFRCGPVAQVGELGPRAREPPPSGEGCFLLHSSDVPGCRVSEGVKVFSLRVGQTLSRGPHRDSSNRWLDNFFHESLLRREDLPLGGLGGSDARDGGIV